MGMYKYIREAWNEPDSELMRKKLILWRHEPESVRLEHPTRLDRARSLGYRAKQGIFVVRQEVPRGSHRKPFPSGGRRSKKYTTRKALTLNYKTIAEARAAQHYVNCEPLNSYQVGRDGHSYWFEVIMVDVSHPAIKADPTLAWITKPGHRGRASRGLTSAAKKGRGLHRKGLGAEKLRPSKTANKARRMAKKFRLKYLGKNK